MPDKDENGVFLGVILHTYSVPPEGDESYRCRVCDKKIIGGGLHVVGYVVNPAVRERELAEWRFGASGIEHILFEQDKDILSRHNIPGAIKVDFYCHDYLCFTLFLRNKYPVGTALLA